MKKLILLAILVCPAFITVAQRSSVYDVNADEFLKRMDSLSDEVVIDLRTPEEVAGGKIPGATEIDFYRDDFKSTIAGLDRRKTYMLYCAGGIRSAKAAAMMKDLGFNSIYNLEDGYKGWVKKKLPTSKGTKPD